MFMSFVVKSCRYLLVHLNISSFKIYISKISALQVKLIDAELSLAWSGSVCPFAICSPIKLKTQLV